MHVDWSCAKNGVSFVMWIGSEATIDWSQVYYAYSST